MNTAKDDMAPEMEALKAKLKATWMSGDFDRIAQSYASGAAEFVARLALQPGERVLDVACGTGNLSFPAARSGAQVIGMDIAPNLLETARVRAQAEGLEIRFDEGDAERLPYEDAAFDTVITMFGAMFAPRPEKAAAELIRVCRSGGRVAMANWTPAGFIGQMFKTISAHVAPPPGISSPVRWGDEETVRERLRDGVTSLQLTRRLISFEFPWAAPEVVEFWRAWYGPTHRAFAALDETGQQALRHDLEALWSEHNQATDGTTHVESEYLEVVAARG
ncbi:MAG TPA: methyltransferase domain-containing protein [Blastocatellia bacterium]|nr:methyltransferase domain-containing protein [Blastocatellia bacterium]